MQTILYSLEDFLREFKHGEYKRPLLIYRPSFNMLSFKDDILSLDCDFVHFSEFTPNPKIEEIKLALKLFKEKQCDSILAIGGGSSIDVGKAVKFYFKDGEIAPIPLIAIPTTAGSGSESTPFSVYYENGVKTSVADVMLIPNVIFLSPEPLLTLPEYVKKTSFMDALSQAIESYWSPISTDESRTYARLGIEGLISAKDEYFSPNPSVECALEIMTASNFSGRAICITRTSAPHAMSYKLTTTFGIAHGHAVALSLIEVWRYMNAHVEDTSDARGVEYFSNALNEIAGFLGCSTSEEGVDFYAELVDSLKLERPTADSIEQIEAFASSVDPSRLKNNPVPLSHEVLFELYSNILNK